MSIVHGQYRADMFRDLHRLDTQFSFIVNKKKKTINFSLFNKILGDSPAPMRKHLYFFLN